MTEPMTAERLAAIRARAAAATPGPWHLDPHATIWSPQDDCVADAWEPTQASGNGEFIAHARQDVGALLAEVDRLQQRVEDLAAAARSAAVLLRSTACRTATPDPLRQAAQALDDIAGRATQTGGAR